MVTNWQENIHVGMTWQEVLKAIPPEAKVEWFDHLFSRVVQTLQANLQTFMVSARSRRHRDAELQAAVIIILCDQFRGCPLPMMEEKAKDTERRVNDILYKLRGGEAIS